MVALLAGVALGAEAWIIGAERADYLALNAGSGDANLVAFERKRGALDAALADLRAILLERLGRTSAGKAANWGGGFKIGSAPVYSFLTRAHLDETSFLYHTFSRASDIMVLRGEDDPIQNTLFGVRGMIAPADLHMPPYMRQRSVHGRIAVYEASSDGYVSLTDIGANYGGSIADGLNPDAGWLTSPMLKAGATIAIGGSDAAGIPGFARFDPIPEVERRLLAPRGQVVRETKEGETYRAEVSALRPCFALIKISYFPGLRATVDSQPARILCVFPDFCAIAVLAGNYIVEVRYRPGPLKPTLF